MQYACSSALREKKGEEGEGKERKRVHFLTSAFNFSAKTSSLWEPLSLSRCVLGVCEAFLLPLPSTFLSNPSGCLPCLFVTIKKLECL